MRGVNYDNWLNRYNPYDDEDIDEELETNIDDHGYRSPKGIDYRDIGGTSSYLIWVSITVVGSCNMRLQFCNTVQLMYKAYRQHDR